MLDRRQMAAGLGLIGTWPSLAVNPGLGGDGTADRDRAGRSTTSVLIDGRGPFRFAIDTAASASVIAADLASRLALPAAGFLDMHTVVGRERVAAVRPATLRSGALSAERQRLAVGSRAGLIGLDGLLGLDLLAGQRLLLRFRGRSGSSIVRSRPDPDRFLGARRPRVRFDPPRGREVGLMAVDAVVRGRAVRAVIDTGAQVTLVNAALARATGARSLILHDADAGRQVQSPTGRTAAAETLMIHGLHFDDLVVDRLAVLAGDFHIFDVLGLRDRPAMLLGVDVLGLFSRVVIDLKRGEIIMEI